MVNFVSTLFASLALMAIHTLATPIDLEGHSDELVARSMPPGYGIRRIQGGGAPARPRGVANHNFNLHNFPPVASLGRAHGSPFPGHIGIGRGRGFRHRREIVEALDEREIVDLEDVEKRELDLNDLEYFVERDFEDLN
ncbi:hypothetical protein CPB83DRAFT_888892 [Crepidotus variabilis]|uniref:Uncharacterized protein n=1 Tax=Crepidotus variabilis TaxID=179855 RepID=A0A9P6JWC5_9AGAR|nr:hypothetical protein CPB83DRAFT_888892 [Crepidotus variabilis]